MRRLPLCSAIVVLCLLPALASEPGEPLDCTDWVSLEPGFYCVPFAPPPCGSDLCAGMVQACDMNGFNTDKPGNHRAIDNAGNLLMVRRVAAGTCDDGVTPLMRVELVRFDGATEVILGYIRERCFTDYSNVDFIAPAFTGLEYGLYEQCGAGTIIFDDKRGRALLPLLDTCKGGPCPYPSDPSHWIAAIEGFSTAFEILQTYQPTTDEFSFRVPYMPEGFQYADYFDTYYGDLASVGDWSQTQPLDCGYPAAPPAVGDYLTVADTLPSPGPGQGYYYVTAVTYQAETRYGRKCINGVLSGRDPAVLPGCAK